MPAENGCSRIHPQGSQIDIQQMLGLSVLASIPLRRREKDGEIRLLPGLWRQGAQALSREEAGGKGEVNKTVLKLLGAVRESYDYVFIDLPPLGSVIDAAVVAAKCDGAILVISDHQVRCHQAVEVVDQLKKCGSRILGVVRNNIHASSSGYYKKYYKNRYQ